jgi:hypothetical protein
MSLKDCKNFDLTEAFPVISGSRGYQVLLERSHNCSWLVRLSSVARAFAQFVVPAVRECCSSVRTIVPGSCGSRVLLEQLHHVPCEYQGGSTKFP